MTRPPVNPGKENRSVGRILELRSFITDLFPSNPFFTLSSLFLLSFFSHPLLDEGERKLVRHLDKINHSTASSRERKRVVHRTIEMHYRDVLSRCTIEMYLYQKLFYVGGKKKGVWWWNQTRQKENCSKRTSSCRENFLSRKMSEDEVLSR